MTSLVPSQSPTVSIVNGKPATTSLEVAKFFGKRHDHVVRDIRAIIEDVPPEMGLPNFGETPYTDEQNGQTYPMFTLHRDGFMLLVMGYTGKKAMQIKVAYIMAFSAMERELVAQLAGCSALPTDPLTLTPTRSSERAPLAKLVKVWANQTRTHPAQCWAMINARFVLDSIDQLPLEWLLDATAFVQTKIDAHNAPPPPPPPLPAPDTTSKAELAAARSALRADVEMLHRMADILQTQITGKIELFKEVANGMLAVKRG